MFPPAPPLFFFFFFSGVIAGPHLLSHLRPRAGEQPGMKAAGKSAQASPKQPQHSRNCRPPRLPLGFFLCLRTATRPATQSSLLCCGQSIPGTLGRAGGRRHGTGGPATRRIARPKERIKSHLRGCEILGGGRAHYNREGGGKKKSPNPRGGDRRLLLTAACLPTSPPPQNRAFQPQISLWMEEGGEMVMPDPTGREELGGLGRIRAGEKLGHGRGATRHRLRFTPPMGEDHAGGVVLWKSSLRGQPPSHNSSPVPGNSRQCVGSHPRAKP